MAYQRASDIHLNLIDMGTEEGGVYLIHQKMYEVIVSSGIMLIDLTVALPDVYIEVGYALSHHARNRLFFFYGSHQCTIWSFY